MHTKAAGRKRRWSLFDVVNTIFLVLLSAIFLYPLLMTLGLSFSSAKELVGKNVILMPIGFPSSRIRRSWRIRRSSGTI